MYLRHLKQCLNQNLDTKMDSEIKKPVLKRPEFLSEVPYDYRNMEKAGPFAGVGERGKVGSKNSTSIDAMPPNKKCIYVPRDHRG